MNCTLIYGVKEENLKKKKVRRDNKIRKLTQKGGKDSNRMVHESIPICNKLLPKRANI